MPGPLALVLSLFAAVSAQAFEQGPTLRQLNGAAAGAALGSAEAASESAKQSFDEPIYPAVFSAPAPGEPAEAPPVRLASKGDFVIGSPQDYREPKNPLAEDDKPKGKGSRWLWKVIGAAVGGVLCGVLGFFLGGPIGAAIGFAAGAVGGWMVTH